MYYPFSEKKIKQGLFLREFDQKVKPEELIWHMDKEDRIIKVVSGNNWYIQFDNKLPILLEKDTKYHIEAYAYHRLLKGTNNLKILVEKKQMKITKSQLKKIIKEEIETMEEPTEDFGTVEEGVENLTPENIQLAMDVLQKLVVEIGLPAAAVAAIVAKIKKHMDSKKER